jgi:uncharacterized membrane protein YphA (DoxX/SURF4 family)
VPRPPTTATRTGASGAARRGTKKRLTPNGTYRAPEFAAYLATAVELACPIFLFLGFATRLAVLTMIGQALVIEISTPRIGFENLGWVSMLLFLFARGAGVFSIDCLIQRWMDTAAMAFMSPSARR